MTRKSFLIQVKPGMEREYERRHNPIWPELQEIYKEHGVSNFSIFHHPSGYLFGYYEVEDETALAALDNNETCKKWWKYMTEILVCETENAEKGKEETLREVFHLP